MPVDSSIALGVQTPKFENPLNMMAQVLQIQGAQNQNSLFPLQMAQQQLATQRAQQQWDMLQPILSRIGKGGQGGDSGMGSGDASQPGGNAMTRALGGNPQGIPTDDGIPYSLADLGALSAVNYPGAKEMLEVKKAAMQGVKFDPGSTYNIGGKVVTVPQLDKGMRMGANGNVEAIPNYAATNADIQGAQAQAAEDAKLLSPDYKGVDGRPIGGFVGDYRKAGSGAQPPAQTAPTPSQPAPVRAPQVRGAMIQPGDTDLPLALSDALDKAKQQLAAAGSDPAQVQRATDDLNGITREMTLRKVAYVPPTARTQYPVASGPLSPAGGGPATVASLGYQPPTTDATGQPVPQQAQQVLAALAQSRDPAKLQNFVDTMQQQIAQMPDPTQRASAGQTLQGEIDKIQQSWQAPQSAPQAGTQTVAQAAPAVGANGRPLLQSATEAAQAAAQVKQATEPNLTYSNDAAKSMAEKSTAVAGQLAEAQNLLQRIGQSREALSKFQSGGGAEWRAKLATIAQAIPGVPATVVNGLAGGDLASLQVFQKFAAQEALETMRQALAADSGKGSQGNRVAMQLFIKNNPNIDTDPNAIEKIFNFQTDLHNQLLNESDMLAKYVSDPKSIKDPAVFNNIYAHSQIDSGRVNPQMVQGQAKGTTPAQTQPAKSAQPAPLVNPQGWRLHTDAHGNRAYVSPDGKNYQTVN